MVYIPLIPDSVDALEDLQLKGRFLYELKLYAQNSSAEGVRPSMSRYPL